MKLGLLLNIVLLMFARAVVAQESCDEARSVWPDVKDSGSEAALQSYANAFSHCGIYHELAQEALRGIGQPQVAMEETDTELHMETETAENTPRYSTKEFDCLLAAGAPTQLPDFVGVDWNDIETDYAIETCKAAASSSPEVQAAFSRAYYKAEEYGLAFDLALEAADGGSGLGMNTVGVAYSHGDGRSQDKEKAFIWFSKAAKTDFPMGQYNLARMYENGEHVEKDAYKAIEIYTQAAESGYTSAQDVLGDMYRRGEDVPKDLGLALRWYERAIESGEDTDSMYWSARIHGGHTGDYPIDELQALEFYERAAYLGDPDAQHSAAQVYFHGYGVEIDHLAAAMYFQAAAEQGHVKSMRKFGRITHESGDVEGAIDWYRKAAAAGDEVAQQLLDEILN
ncbi:tetratricopeptide repeat protein [Falsihalocynthiibacter sp. S25ZX9]|uniref:tetratricopeptide repeat protein n=1 Tax=Falsihalocynthiibacter sp. S25ZX9 TaxID=3240870 RepID=UPI00350FD8F9